jgi:secreted PhoX family phosphatase
MNRKSLLAAAVAAAAAATAVADSTVVNGPMAFDPIAGSAYTELTTDPVILNSQPWIIPQGYSQYIVSDESNLDIYAGSDWNDMNTVNETGKHAGRYLYRTHEVRPSASNPGAYTGGAVSVVDLKTGEAKLVAQRLDWEALDGIVWTPWGTLLFAEETGGAVFTDPDHPAAVRGLLYEMKPDKKDPARAEWVKVRPLLGSVSHEGIEIDSEGNVYVIDENGPGAIYKFVPQQYGDLSDGQLYALKVDDSATGDRVGPAEWVALDMNLAQMDARAAAVNAGATGYGRPEDLERIGSTLYVAITSEARVLSISLGDKPVVQNFVRAGLNVPVENRTAGITGFRNPDNLASGPDGKLWIVEDNVPSDIWVALPDKDGDGASDGVHLFATLKDNGAEGTGIYVGKDPRTLFVNVQHSATGNDKTMAITNREGGHGHDHHDHDD